MSNAIIGQHIKQFGRNLMRIKNPPLDSLTSDLNRCLGLIDLTLLSVGGMIGTGIFLTIGEVTREAGPSVILSYLLAGIASILSALCYAELSARYSIAGSSYQFTYMAIGEIWAFFIGWNIILEHAIGSASVVRGCSRYIDSLFGNVIKDYMMKHAPMPGGLIATYPDFLGPLFMTFIILLLIFRVNLSSKVNIFLILVICMICFFIVGFILGDKSNWTDKNRGGFLPNGFSATLAASSTLIYSFIGYEVVSSIAEEAENPRRNLPLSLFISVSVTTVLYMSVAAAYVSIVPWYKASVAAPLVDAYEALGWHWAKYVVVVGMLVGSAATAIAITMAIPRYIFAMARDGLLMEFLAKVNSHEIVPLYATVTAGGLCIFLTITFSVEQLINFMSIGQLIACIFVAVCVIKLRYQPLKSRGCLHDDLGNVDHQDHEEPNTSTNLTSQCASEDTSLIIQTTTHDSTHQIRGQYASIANATGTIYDSIQKSRFGYLFEWTKLYKPGTVPMFSLVVAIIFSTLIMFMVEFGISHLREWWFIVASSSFLLITVASIIFMFMFVQDDKIDTYKIPCVPLSPFLSIIINLLLLMNLSVETWIRLGIWMVIGFGMYFGYGYSHSKAHQVRSRDES